MEWKLVFNAQLTTNKSDQRYYSKCSVSGRTADGKYTSRCTYLSVLDWETCCDLVFVSASWSCFLSPSGVFSKQCQRERERMCVCCCCCCCFVGGSTWRIHPAIGSTPKHPFMILYIAANIVWCSPRLRVFQLELDQEGGYRRYMGLNRSSLLHRV